MNNRPTIAMKSPPIITALHRAFAKAGGQNAWADAHGIDRGYLSRIATGKAPVTDAVAALLGFERVVSFKRRKC